MPRSARVLLAGILLCAGLPAPAQTGEPQQFSIPRRGSLALTIPPDWTAQAKALDQPPSVTLRIAPREGNRFNLQITALWLDDGKRAGFTEAALKSRVQETANGQLAQAEETEVKLQELLGPGAVGYYYTFTGKGAPAGPGNYRYLTQGTLVVGDLVMIFTFLHRDAAAPDRDIALRMLADAGFVKSGPLPPGAAAAASPADGFRFDMPEPRLRVTIPDIPQFALGVHPNAGTQPQARHFGAGPGGFSLSILLPTAGAGMKSIDCARSMFRSLVERYNLDPKFVVSNRNSDATFLMLFPFRAGPIVQLKAYLLSGTGTHCVEVHVSKTLEATSKEAGADAIAAWFQGFRQATIESY